jgi:hypothetical protein
MVGGAQHEHIAELRWRDTDTGETGAASRAEMVRWVTANPGRAIVHHGGRTSYIGVVHPNYGPPFVRTYADSYWNDNLLALPRY